MVCFFVVHRNTQWREDGDFSGFFPRSVWWRDKGKKTAFSDFSVLTWREGEFAETLSQEKGVPVSGFSENGRSLPS
jgi:hypothetical protein